MVRRCGQAYRHPASGKTNRVCDKDLYRARHLIENLFRRLEQSRAIATR